MKLMEVEIVPQNVSTRHYEVKAILTEFLESGVDKAKIVLEPGENIPPLNAFRYFTRGVNALPVAVHERDSGIFLTRRTI